MRRIATHLAVVTIICAAGCTSKSKKTEVTRSESQDMYADEGYTSTYTPRDYESPSLSSNERAPVTRAEEPVYSEPAYADDGFDSRGERFHVVVKSDTLYKLARTYYSDQSKWRDIYEANRGNIDDPNFIRVGQRLVIP